MNHVRTAMIAIRSIIFNVLFYLAFLGLMVIGMPFILLRRRRVVLVFVRTWARVSLLLLRHVCGIRVEFRNPQHRPRGPAILAVKHQSFLETFALITAVDDFAYVLKKELLAIPFFGWYLRGSEQIGIDRSKGGKALASMDAAVRERLAQGRQIIIFPEGTRQPIGATPAYKVGVAALCAHAGVPCTPVALNTAVFWPRHSFIRRPGTCVIEFLPPIPPTRNKRAFMHELEAAIESATAALLEEALTTTLNGSCAEGRSTPATA